MYRLSHFIIIYLVIKKEKGELGSTTVRWHWAQSQHLLWADKYPESGKSYRPHAPNETYQGHQLKSGQISTHTSSYSGQLKTYSSSHKVKICKAVNDIKISTLSLHSPQQQSKWASVDGRPGRSHTTGQHGGSLTGRDQTRWSANWERRLCPPQL